MRKKNPYYRLFPITHPSYRVVRIAGEQMQEGAAAYFSGKMLDIGCGTKAKRLLVGEYVEEYIGLDHEECQHDHAKIDIFATAYEVPVENDHFDCVLSTAVLEHLEEPGKALAEACRVLKPGGCALYTMPLIWHLHEEPRDFFRFTRFGLKHLFETAGFEIVEIKALSGFWTTFGAEFGYYLLRFAKGPLNYLVKAIIIFINLLFHELDRGLLRDERFTWMYLVIARKTLAGTSAETRASV